MRVLAIDPGTEKSGYAYLLQDEIQEGGTAENTELLQRIARNDYDVLVIEELTYCHRGGYEIMRTVWWSGVFSAVCSMHGGKYQLIARNIVKEILIGRLWGTDAEVKKALVTLREETGKKKPLQGLQGHEIQAVAAGIAWRISAGHSVYPRAAPSDDKRKPRKKREKKKKEKKSAMS